MCLCTHAYIHSSSPQNSVSQEPTKPKKRAHTHGYSTVCRACAILSYTPFDIQAHQFLSSAFDQKFAQRSCNGHLLGPLFAAGWPIYARASLNLYNALRLLKNEYIHALMITCMHAHRTHENLVSLSYAKSWGAYACLFYFYFL